MMPPLSLTPARPARPSRPALGLLAACLAAAPAGLLAASGSTKLSAPEAAYPHSLFTDEIGQGRDPFFPRSARRQPKTVADASAQPKKAQPALETLSVRGILAASNHRRLALINGRVFAQGETFDISVPNGRMRVRCLEIKPASVVLSVEGGPDQFELHMRHE